MISFPIFLLIEDFYFANVSVIDGDIAYAVIVHIRTVFVKLLNNHKVIIAEGVDKILKAV